jgi:hypothetical protein
MIFLEGNYYDDGGISHLPKVNCKNHDLFKVVECIECTKFLLMESGHRGHEELGELFWCCLRC